VGANGQVIYEKGDDHLIDADRCAILAWYQDTQTDSPVPLGLGLESF
jgi:hypothetical protein